MQKKKFVQNVTIIVLAVAIIIMSVGYATYYTPLTIEGTTTIEKASWDIHFANPTKTANTTVDEAKITAPSLATGTSLSFGVSMPLDSVYEFTVDVENDGTFDAKLTDFNLTVAKDGGAATQYSTLSYANENESLKYSVKWADGSEVTKDSVIAKETNKKLLVRVEYKDDNAAGFNSGTLTEAPDAVVAGQDATYVFTASLTYTQAN